MAKCSVCGAKIMEGLDKCPICGTKVIKKAKNGAPSAQSSEAIFSFANIDFDMFDVVAIVILGLYTLVTLIGFFSSLIDSYNIVYSLLSALHNLTYCLSFWGLFVYYKTKEKMFKLIDGVLILVSVFFIFLFDILCLAEGYYGFFSLLGTFITTLAPIAIPFIIIVLKNKDEKNNIKL